MSPIPLPAVSIKLCCYLLCDFRQLGQVLHFVKKKETKRKPLKFAEMGRKCKLYIFPLRISKKFRKFLSEIKWNGPFCSDPTGIYGTTCEGGL